MDSNVRRYLSVRSRNFLSVPNSIHTLKSLGEHIDIVSSPGRYSRFFQVDRKPKVFVSSNTWFRKQHTEFLNDAYAFIHREVGEKNVQEVREEGKQSGFNSDRALKYISESDLFVLFYSKVDRASFSLIELGWALAHTKKCLIICEKDALDYRVLNNDKIDIVIIGNAGQSESDNLNRVQELLLDMISKLESDHKHYM